MFPRACPPWLIASCCIARLCPAGVRPRFTPAAPAEATTCRCCSCAPATVPANAPCCPPSAGRLSTGGRSRIAPKAPGRVSVRIGTPSRRAFSEVDCDVAVAAAYCACWLGGGIEKAMAVVAAWAEAVEVAAGAGAGADGPYWAPGSASLQFGHATAPRGSAVALWWVPRYQAIVAHRAAFAIPPSIRLWVCIRSRSWFGSVDESTNAGFVKIFGGQNANQASHAKHCAHRPYPTTTLQVFGGAFLRGERRCCHEHLMT